MQQKSSETVKSVMFFLKFMIIVQLLFQGRVLLNMVGFLLDDRFFKPNLKF